MAEEDARDAGSADDAPPPPPPPSPPSPPLPLPPSPPLPDDATIASSEARPSDVGPTGTSIFPTVSETGPEPYPAASAARRTTAPQPAAPTPQPARWSARAQVRSPDAGLEPAAGDWDDSAAAPPRGLFVPVLVGAAVLLIGALVGLAVWLASRDDGSTPVTPTTTTTRPVKTTKPPTTNPPTTTVPPTTAPATVVIPNVRGLAFDVASALLTSKGLTVSQQAEESAEIEAGRVTRTDPAIGQEVQVGSTVTVYVSLGGPTAEPPTTSPSPT